MPATRWTQTIPKLQARFRENFETGNEIGASVSLWQNDTEVFCFSDGSLKRDGLQPWTNDTLVPVWSATKGPAAACVHHALQLADLSLSTPVADVWSEFSRAGKGHITILQLLSHQAGLAALDEPIPIDHYERVVAALEAQPPLWPVSECHGYHARTFGFLVDELVRRLSNAPSLGTFWREHFAEPLGFDIWIGLPASEDSRVATLYPGRVKSDAASEEAAFYSAFEDPESLTRRAFTSPQGLHAVADLNRPEVWRIGYPAMGGLASARGLAAFYAFLASGGEAQGKHYFSEESLAAMRTTQIQGTDRILLRQTAFSAGFMKDPLDSNGSKLRHLFGTNQTSFGHPGAGGSHAFADPDSGIGFAYVMNQMERSVLPNEKSTRLVEALFS